MLYIHALMYMIMDKNIPGLLIMYHSTGGNYCFDKYSQSSVGSMVRLPRRHEAVVVL